MANKCAIQNGNWSDGSTWNDGVVPTAADDVWLNGYNVNLNGIIQLDLKSLHNDIFEQTDRFGGYLTNNAVIENLVLNCNIVGDGISNILFFDTGSNYTKQVVIQGDVNNALFHIRYSNVIYNINGDCKNSYFYVQGYSNYAPKQIILNGISENVSIGGDSGSWAFTINGVLTQNKNFFTFIQTTTVIWNINGIINFVGDFKITQNYVGTTNNFRCNINGIIDISQSNYDYIPIESTANTITITKLKVLPSQIQLPPESVVLEGYEYGNKVGMLKTVPDNVAIVNLTEQQLQRVGNCATVSTVQKCFEDFKE